MGDFRSRDPLDDDGEAGRTPPRRARFHEVSSEAELDRVLAAAGGTRLLFLHDPYCPISSRAYEEVERVPGEVHIIDVASQSALGRMVQARTGIRHESPQAIVLRDGQPTWHASHGRIRLASLQEALKVG
jgi:bacillithiol system protein YtxJ